MFQPTRTFLNMPPSKRKSPIVIKPSPNKKKAKSKEPITPVPMTVLTDIMTDEQVQLATTTFKILKKEKKVIIVGAQDKPGCTKTIIGGEAIRLYAERLVWDSRLSHTTNQPTC